MIRLPATNVVVVLPDSHAHPDYDNDRFDYLGKFLLDLCLEDRSRGVVLLNLGDMADMPSLSSYDKGHRSFEGRRYWKDVAAVVDAQERLFGPINKYNSRAKKNRKAGVQLRTIHTLGNHDDGRISKVTDLHPELDGTISLSDLQYDKYWDTIVPFKEAVNVEGVMVSHYFATGVSGRPIGGDNPARSILMKNHTSSIQGHSHLWDIKEVAARDGTTRFGLVGGCYCHEGMVAGWNRDTVHYWNNCVTVLHNLQDGSYESFSKISLKTLKNRY